MPKPLEGIRVVELARVLAGPWCGQLLADLGAEVVKVERPGAGDDTRSWGPPFIVDESGKNLGAAYYHSTNRGKTGVAIDIATIEGQAAVRALIADADVVIENYKVGGLAKYGLDPASLCADFPRLIVCSITGFGQTGPYAHRAGYDFIIQAMGGAMSLTGEPDGAPQKAGIAYADIFTGMYSTVAILAALRRRDATGDAQGGGAHIDMALLDCQVGVLANQAANYLASGVSPRRMGNGHANVVPYQAFATADGQLVIAVGNDGQFRKLCVILGEPGWAYDKRFVTNAARLANRAELIPLLAAKIATWDALPLSLALEAEGVPAGPINDIASVFADPQVQARGMRFRPDGASVDGLASPIVIDGERMVARTGAPPLSP
ncbi:CoA-transferase [Sphingopyxis sp. H038]|uniref:CaiB/BaiF CoA transferase family protein n=1 Tax=unclassified Sphingopyxis TaxID=2614943 RepID=UPI00072FEA30|nr:MULTISPECIES: CaiB/BaiF CoA-transferase family protein [unclassified Sphingopyxis]KTE00105.1 CoA-transferase [Sphingopyxis sp. H012]KTE07690.1 CoA-transferase [Sphingopyxis sp. H053]KTE11507.1 CoA-transferase [Sphingopyxis sp. H093]KTE27569.1 CoA-transferase [Sphingopyxis sp. H080]KTE33920.1 CoA-transferase [Sphingopyxis sp. H038]